MIFINKNAEKLCTEHCFGCHYSGIDDEGKPICLYILYTGHQRPCAPGDECTSKRAELRIGAVWEGAYPEYDITDELTKGRDYKKRRKAKVCSDDGADTF